MSFCRAGPSLAGRRPDRPERSDPPRLIFPTAGERQARQRV
ncbi:hypothetical protein SZ55_1589 [Pseudomonas sp. FeS53a]|nr:hypothetical protein SZ55_1589 [Pseudomonas sp. FeS53a]